ncbi:MAG: hypothetical protein R2883_01275 [Caldisericia bacterium]
MGNGKEIDWIIKHACRTLLKNGDPETLQLFGYVDPDHIILTDVFQFLSL